MFLNQGDACKCCSQLSIRPLSTLPLVLARSSQHTAMDLCFLIASVLACKRFYFAQYTQVHFLKMLFVC